MLTTWILRREQDGSWSVTPTNPAQAEDWMAPGTWTEVASLAEVTRELTKVTTNIPI